MPTKKNTDAEDAKGERSAMRTLHIRIRDKHAKFLRALAYDVNQVWNFCVRREVAFSIVPAIGTCFPIGSTLDRQADLVTDRSEALLTTYPCATSASANPRGSSAALVASIR